jgi:hypothetical protein
MPDLDPINSIRLKIEGRLRSIASICRIDTGPSFSLRELSTMLCELNSLSPTEFWAIKYIMDFCDKAAYANRVDPYKIKEATAIGERVIRIIDKRLEMQ